MTRIFTEGFRVFFLAAGIYAIVAIAMWLGVLSGGPEPFAMSATLWHAHEMVFGFAGAALGGFFLTAVPNWTGAKSAPRRFIAMVAALWLAGRVAVWFSGGLPAGFVAVVDLAFLPVLAAKILTQLLKRPKPQNMMFLILLTLVWIGNLLMHLDWMGLTVTAPQGLRGGMLAVCAMIAVLGGRVTPAFTRNAMLREGIETGLPVSRKWADLPGTVLPILLAAMVLAEMPAAWVAIAAGVFTAIRLAGWRPDWSRRQPIVLALHLGYGMLALGFLCWGLAGLGIGSELAALHVLGIGAIGGMTLAVMSRAGLGHTGRPLVAPGPLALAYLLMPLAVALRIAAAEWGTFWQVGTFAAGLIWMLAFALYLAAMWPAFTQPKLRKA